MTENGEATPETLGLRARIHAAWRAARGEVCRAGALFGVAFIVGAIYVSTWGGAPEFWQQVFGPSVMTACGRGFTNPHMSEVPALEDFLYLRAQTFDCASIPDQVTLLPDDTSGMPYDEIQAFHPLGQFPGWTQWQRFHRYLLLSVALMFSLFGVAWSSLTPLYALLYGTTNALAYGIFRLALRPRLATLFTLLLITSPLHLQQLPQLRDYSKAPFFFALMLAAGWIVKRPLPLRALLPMALAAGLFGGLGLGFRQDVSIAAALFCGLTIFFMAGSWRETVLKRVATVAVFLLGFAVLGAPIFQVLSRVNNATHDTIIGFTRYCDQRLGVGTPLYDFGDPFMDEYVRAMIMGHAYRTEGRTEVFRHYSPDYDAAGKAYFREMATTFPADLILRSEASVLRIVDELQISSADGTPRGITNQFLARLWQWRQWALDALPGGGRYHVALMLLILVAANPRMAIALFGSILLLAGYPALRFSERHAFHMEIIALFAASFLLQCCISGGIWLWRNRRERAWPVAPRIALIRVAVAAVLASVLLAAPLYAARWWQAGNVAALIEAYEAAPTTPLSTQITTGTDLDHVALPGVGDVNQQRLAGPALAMYTEVLVLEFAPGESLNVGFTFAADHPNFEFDRTMVVPASDDTVRLYYPLYFGPGCRFTGLELPPGTAGRLEQISRISDLSGFRILLNATVPRDWTTLPHYQRLTR